MFFASFPQGSPFFYPAVEWIAVSRTIPRAFMKADREAGGSLPWYSETETDTVALKSMSSGLPFSVRLPWPMTSGRRSGMSSNNRSLDTRGVHFCLGEIPEQRAGSRRNSCNPVASLRAACLRSTPRRRTVPRASTTMHGFK